MWGGLGERCSLGGRHDSCLHLQYYHQTTLSDCKCKLCTPKFAKWIGSLQEPGIAIMELENITSQVEDIGVDEFSLITSLIEAISSGVQDNRDVSTQ